MRKRIVTMMLCMLLSLSCFSNTFTALATEVDKAKTTTVAKTTAEVTQKTVVTTKTTESTASTKATEETTKQPQIVIEEKPTDKTESKPSVVEEKEITGTDKYILDNINPQYAKAEKLEPHDILLVKQTLANGYVVPENITFKDLFNNHADDGNLVPFEYKWADAWSLFVGQ